MTMRGVTASLLLEPWNPFSSVARSRGRVCLLLRVKRADIRDTFRQFQNVEISIWMLRMFRLTIQYVETVDEHLPRGQWQVNDIESKVSMDLLILCCKSQKDLMLQCYSSLGLCWCGSVGVGVRKIKHITDLHSRHSLKTGQQLVA